MDPIQFNSMSPEEQAKTLASLKGLIGVLESKREDARDGATVWIVNRHGIRDVCVYRHWRTFLSRHSELGVRLLDPHEVVEEEAKVAQAAALRSEKAREWRRLPVRIRQEYGGPDALSLEDMRALNERADPVEQLVALQARQKELEGPLAPAPRRRSRGRPNAAVPTSAGVQE